MSHLTQEQRYTIEVLKKENYSQTAIAERIGKLNSISKCNISVKNKY